MKKFKKKTAAKMKNLRKKLFFLLTNEFYFICNSIIIMSVCCSAEMPNIRVALAPCNMSCKD